MVTVAGGLSRNLPTWMLEMSRRMLHASWELFATTGFFPKESFSVPVLAIVLVFVTTDHIPETFLVAPKFAQLRSKCVYLSKDANSSKIIL